MIASGLRDLHLQLRDLRPLDLPLRLERHELQVRGGHLGKHGEREIRYKLPEPPSSKLQYVGNTLGYTGAAKM